MTIKKRVSLSNILMIIIPVLLSAAISYLILFVFTRSSDVALERAFPQAFDVVLRFQRSGNLAELRENVDDFNALFQQNEVYMAVLDGEEFLYPDDAPLVLKDHALLQILLRDGATGSLNVNNMSLVVEQMGEYRIVLVQNAPDGISLRPHLLRIPVILGIVLFAILCTNRLLTHILSRSITVPLKKLADGAHQLGEGNLDYRIDYNGKDEFLAVSDAFNKMAAQLQKLIQYQTKNEQNRKELLAGISHDLRTPLTSIKAYVEGLLDGVAEDLPAQLKYLSIIRNKAEDIDHIVDKLFLFSKLDIGDYPVKLEQVDIGEELRTMERTAEEEYLEKGVQVRVQDQIDGVFIYMDPVYLHNIFVNILENSLRYRNKETSCIEVRCFVSRFWVTVWMTDDGPGVPEEALEKIFEVFYRGDPSRHNPSKGSGLGLAISAKMMNRIGGEIFARNAPEGGLRMIMKFPRHLQEGEKADEENSNC